jgi:hypothetical protein
MERPRGLAFERSLVFAASALFLADTFLPWQQLSQGQFSYSWNAWHGDKGVLMGSLAAALIVCVAACALGLAESTRVPEAGATLALAVLVFTLAVVKNVHDDYSAWGSYVGLVVAAGIVAAAWQPYRREATMPPALARD